MRRSTAALLAAAVAFGVIGAGAALSSSRDWAAAEGVVEDLASLNHSAMEHALRLETGIDQNMDLLAKDIMEEHAATDHLEQLTRAHGDGQLHQHLEDLEGWRLEHEAVLNRLQSSSALLEASLTFLEDLEADLGPLPEAQRTQVGELALALLRHLKHRELRATGQPERGGHEPVLSLIDALERTHPAGALEAYLKRARLALAQGDARAASLAELTVLQEQAPYAAIREHLREHREDAHKREHWAGALLSIAGITLAGALVQAGLQLRQGEQARRGVVEELRAAHEQLGLAHQQLQSAAAELEARVAERTNELGRANERLQDMSRAKSEFLANMSHEIRTPLAAVQGYAELLLDGELPSTQRKEHLQTIRRNGEHLLAIINDILDISKVEAGKMVIEQIPYSPSGVLLEVLSMLRVRALERGVELSVGLDGPLPEEAKGDPVRLRQIVLNLTGNALKFTERGSVRVTASCPVERGAAMLVVRVRDTGIGIAPRDLERLFTPFEQVDSGANRRWGGTGLGLAISQRLARLMGGEISAESAPGVGSCFTLRVPTDTTLGRPWVRELVEVVPERLEPIPAVIPRLSARVLLAEDGRDNQRLIVAHLERAGARVIVVDNGLSALETALEAERRGQPFDVVLMDMQMPQLDGFAAAARLRERGYRRPILALTAHAMAGDQQRCLAAGCDAHLTKPISRAELVNAVDRWSTLISMAPRHCA